MNDTTSTTTNEMNGTATASGDGAVINPNFSNLVELKQFKFNFKTVILKDEEGKEIGKSKRPTVELMLPVPSVEGIAAAAAAGGNQLALLLEAVENIVTARARELVNDNESINQENFPFDQITWEAIANLPAAEKRGRGIPKEVWEEFSADYIQVMPALTGKTEKQIAAAAEILLDKFNKLKGNKDYKKIVKLLLDQLSVYMNSAANAETYMDCISFLTDKGTRILTAEEVSLLESL